MPTTTAGSSVIVLLALLLSRGDPTVAIVSSDGPVVCSGTQESDQTGTNSINKMKDLRERFTNCQYVIGDVHIRNINQTELVAANVSFDFNFLDSIQEVTGCVKIIDSCFSSHLAFKNLRIIRGSNCVHADASLLVQFSTNCHLRPPPIDMRSLRYIASGNVFLFGISNCYIERLVNHYELFQDATAQSLVHRTNCTRAAVDRCHVNCPVWETDGNRHCWGPGPDQCQARSRCVRTSLSECPHQRCFEDSTDLERCCSEQCLGGCSGVLASQCYGCSGFSLNGTCVSTCNPEPRYDSAKTEHVQQTAKPYRKYGPVCVPRCPASFFVQSDACVSKCMPGYSASTDNICALTQATRICEEHMKANSMICSIGNPLLEGLLNDSLLCTEFFGTLTISSGCFTSAGSFQSMQKLSLAQLYHIFSRLRVLRGTVQVNLEGSPDITNLTFFSKLERLHKTPGQDRTGFILVHSNHITFLGLSSLRYISGGIFIWLRSDLLNQPDLKFNYCPGFQPSIRAQTDSLIEYGGTQSEIVRTLKTVANKTSGCPIRPAACHELCDLRYGCWGPGPGFCVRCAGVKAGDKCAPACDDAAAAAAPGWFDGGESVRLGASNLTERHCSPCHSTCSACTGPTEMDCTLCKPGTYRDGSQCVGQCNREFQYPDENSICRQCPRVCVNVKLGRPGRPTCTGNASLVGPGGCQFCTQIIQMQRSPSDPSLVLRCLAQFEQCPEGYYAAVLDPSLIQRDFPEFAALQQLSTYSVSICLRCDYQCLRCKGSSTACSECRHYNVIQPSLAMRCAASDSPRCPAGYYPVHANRTCHPCHPACSSCSGPHNGDCHKCSPAAYVLLADYSNPETSNFTCFDKCPDTHQFPIFHKLHGTVCSSNPIDLQGSQQNTSIPGVLNEASIKVIAISMTALVVLIIVGFFVWYWLKQRGSKHRKQRKDSTTAASDDDLQPMNPSDGVMPNRRSLLTISEKELIRGREVGSGAFGTVYKGEWICEAENRRRSIVAIKILSDSGDSNMSGELLEESKIMASVDHPHCVRLVGICMTQPLQLITQFMKDGNLRDFLRNRRDTGTIGSSHLLRYAAQIASGMAYLEQCQIIHRDLACRNVLVASEKSVKITDFGLAKVWDNPREPYTASGGKLPVKWLALESLVSRTFSHKSDVWAYGVTLWELFTFGEPPYPNVKPKDLADYLEKGERLPQPTICTLDVYMVMIKCWMLNDQHRPTFEQMEMEFKKMAMDPGRYVYIQGDKFARTASRGSNSDASSVERHSNIEQRSVSPSPPLNHGLSNSLNSSSLQPRQHAPGPSYTVLNHGATAMLAMSPMAESPHRQGPANADSNEDVFMAETLFVRSPPPTLPYNRRPSGKLPPPQQPQRLLSSNRTFYDDNTYTSDPCKPPPHQQALGSPGSSSSGDGYLLPIQAPVSRNGSTRGPLPPTPQQAPPPLPPPPPSLAVAGTPTIQNPEYFFNSTRTTPTTAASRGMSRSSSSHSSRSPPPPLPPPPPPPLLPPPL